jgi:peroxiredoxin
LWAVGTIAPVVVLDDRNGNRITVDWEQQQKNTVLYVFSPNCGWCQRNLNAVRALVQQQADRYVVVPIALSRKEELEGKPTAELGVSPYLISSPIHRAGYHFGGTPQTIVVDKRGKVLANWIGAYTPGVRPEVEHLLGITIPPIGLSAALNEVPR